MSNRQFRLQELAEAERRIAAALKLIEQSHLDRATTCGRTAALTERTVDIARTAWLTLELRRLELLHALHSGAATAQ